MPTLVARFLDLADELIERHPRSSASKRRAVSTAYYAAFHAVMRRCADILVRDTKRESTAYARVYRTLDHGSLKNAFKSKDSPLNQTDSLRRIGTLIVTLQSARMQADYSPPRKSFYEANQAKDLLAQAREIVALVEGLSEDEAITLAVHLLFKDRP